jgi:hypothetical protein
LETISRQSSGSRSGSPSSEPEIAALITVTWRRQPGRRRLRTRSRRGPARRRGPGRAPARPDLTPPGRPHRCSPSTRPPGPVRSGAGARRHRERLDRPNEASAARMPRAPGFSAQVAGSCRAPRPAPPGAGPGRARGGSAATRTTRAGGRAGRPAATRSRSSREGPALLADGAHQSLAGEPSAPRPAPHTAAADQHRPDLGRPEALAGH